MPGPSASYASLRPELGGSFMEFSLDMAQLGYVGLRIFPVVDSAKKSGSFGRVPLAELLQKRETRRSPGAAYNRGGFRHKPEPFACEEHGWEEPVDDQESELYREFFVAEQVAAFRARQIILQSQEERIQAIIQSTTIFQNTAVSAGVWSLDTSKPIDDMEVGIKAVYDQSGLIANTIAMSWKTFRTARNNPQIVDRIKYAGIMDPAQQAINPAALAQLFDVEQVVVAGSVQNTANEGQAASLASLWDDDKVWVGRTARTMDIQEPCAGRVIHWSADGSQIGGTVESYREERNRSEILRVRHDVDEKLLHAAAGHIITGVA